VIRSCALPLAGYSEDSGAIFASPNVAEKGKLDVKMEVSTKGGHSSIPPLHTVISMFSFRYIAPTNPEERVLAFLQLPSRDWKTIQLWDTFREIPPSILNCSALRLMLQLWTQR
jgi:hypothetical protein